VLGASLRNVLAKSTSNRLTACLSGIGVTALVQSSTATALIVAAFVGQGLMSLPSALAVMLGADIGTSLMAVVFSRDLSWLSPLFILVGVVLFILRQSTTLGRVGRVLIGLGLMLLALKLVTQSANVLTQAAAVKSLLAALTSDLLLEIFVGALLAVFSYSSLAIVLLTATLALSHVIPIDVALGLVLGANLGSGLLAVLTTLRAKVETRQVPLGNLIFKAVGIAIAAPLISLYMRHIPTLVGDLATQVVLFHLAFNLVMGLLFISFTGWVAQAVEKWLPKPLKTTMAGRQRHLDASALATPSLAISCAVRESMHQADVVENMLTGMLTVIKTSDRKLAADLRAMDNTVQSIETSSLHLDLISDLKRINSHICSIAYPILDSAGALAPNRLRQNALLDS
jgi:phosphate:Na+ symporter